MAVGFLGKKKGDARSNTSSSDDANEKKDPESLGRIEAPSRRDMAGDDSSDSSITVGKQMEMEAENAIKYRTCSWPKVCIRES